MRTTIIRPPVPAAVSCMPADSIPMLRLDCIRSINLIVVHCTASRCDRRLTPDDLEAEHRRRNFNGCGYHFFITREGIIFPMRPLDRVGAHRCAFSSANYWFSTPGAPSAGIATSAPT